MPNIVLFGAPGAGKGTLAGVIKKFSSIVHVSTGDLFRENMKNNTPIGQKAKEFIEAGKLVPDSVVIDMVKDRLDMDDVKASGVMLDGFPRTAEQAKALDQIVSLDHVAVIRIEKEVLKKRILGRYTCPKCNRIYNIYSSTLAPKEGKLCDDCKVELNHRSDDNEETFQSRWQTYLDQSEPALDYYRNRPNLIVELDGELVLTYPKDQLKAQLGL